MGHGASRVRDLDGLQINPQVERHQTPTSVLYESQKGAPLGSNDIHDKSVVHDTVLHNSESFHKKQPMSIKAQSSCVHLGVMGRRCTSVSRGRE